jgi:hypothetical protein
MRYVVRFVRKNALYTEVSECLHASSYAVHPSSTRTIIASSFFTKALARLLRLQAHLIADHTHIALTDVIMQRAAD